MDLRCYRCNFRGLTQRQDLIGCRACGLWMEKYRYGLRPAERLKRPEPKAPQPEMPELKPRRKVKGTFFDPGGP